MADFKDKLQAFLDHYETLNSIGEEAEEGFNSEFVKLKLESQVYKDNNTFPAEAGQQPHNRKKNRFKDILPYEYTRVQLHKTEGVEGSDYINANYIQGADGSVTYIAAQGPLPHTVDDFWRMIWYHQIEIVVMVCKEVEMGRTKCQCYWPPVGESQMYGAIKVTTKQEESISDDFTVRELLAECQGEEQVIRQYHYNAWPDHGRPVSPLPIIRMVERINDHRKRHDIPIVVHCSAGCGRTGTIIAIDYARTILLSKEIPEELSVFSIVHDMRKQRPSMVQAKDQYVFVYMAVAELIRRILGNVPQAPPKQLNFEKKGSKPKMCPNGEDIIYENIALTPQGTPQAERKMVSAELSEPTSDVKASKNSPLLPPRAITWTTSGGRTDNGSKEGKPPPPAKPKTKPKPEKVERPETPKKDHPEPAPRKKLDNVPIPVPRRHSPIPPSTNSTPPTVTPTPTPTSTSKGYVNVPSGSQSSEVESTYSVVKKNVPSPAPTVTSTPKGKAPSANTSGSSILDTLLTECGDVFSEEDIRDITGDPGPLQSDTSYSMLGTVEEAELPPEIPVQTLESTQLLIGGIEEKEDPVKSSSIYETPDPSLISPPQSSTSLAYTIPRTPQQQNDTTGPSKGKRTLGIFKKTSAKDRKHPTEDLIPGVMSGHQSLPPISRAHASGASLTSPKKHPPEVPPAKLGGANNKYKFPGDFGYGVRVGKPKGPRPMPSHWSIPNGLIH